VIIITYDTPSILQGLVIAVTYTRLFYKSTVNALWHHYVGVGPKEDSSCHVHVFNALTQIRLQAYQISTA